MYPRHLYFGDPPAPASYPAGSGPSPSRRRRIAAYQQHRKPSSPLRHHQSFSHIGHHYGYPSSSTWNRNAEQHGTRSQFHAVPHRRPVHPQYLPSPPLQTRSRLVSREWSSLEHRPSFARRFAVKRPGPIVFGRSREEESIEKTAAEDLDQHHEAVFKRARNFSPYQHYSPAKRKRVLQQMRSSSPPLPPPGDHHFRSLVLSDFSSAPTRRFKEVERLRGGGEPGQDHLQRRRRQRSPSYAGLYRSKSDLDRASAAALGPPLSKEDKVKKSRSFHHKLPETSVDIHRLIFESDQRIKELVSTKPEEDDDEDEDDAIKRCQSSSEREFQCHECGTRNKVKTSSKSKRLSAMALRLRSRRKASKSRLLNGEEQAKLGHFRRYLRGAGIGYHDLAERVEEIWLRQRRERREEVDENGIRIWRKAEGRKR